MPVGQPESAWSAPGILVAMRFLHFDRVTVLVKGERIRGCKSFSLAEPYIEHHFPRMPVVPAALQLESMAQLVGWGIAHALEFRALPIMSLARGLTFAEPLLRPGLTVEVVGEFVAITTHDSLGRAWIEHEGQRIATVEGIIYTHVPAREPAELRRLCAYLAGPGVVDAEPAGIGGQ